MFDLIRNNGLLLVLAVLPMSILAHNLFGAALAKIELKDSFSRETLKKGLTKGFLVYLGILIYAFMSYLMVDLKIELAGELYSLIDAMYLIVLAAIIRYSKQGIEKLMEILKYEVTKEEDRDE